MKQGIDLQKILDHEEALVDMIESLEKDKEHQAKSKENLIRSIGKKFHAIH